MSSLKRRREGIFWSGGIKIVLAFLICFFIAVGSARAADYTYTALNLGLSSPQINGIANDGTIVGTDLYAGGFIANKSGIIQFIAPSGWSETYANGISSDGKYIVGGGYDADGALQTFSYSSGTPSTISVTGLTALYGSGVNNSGTVVGSGWSDDAFTYVGFSSTGTAGLLQDSWSTSFASAINNSGIIAGHGTDASGNYKGFTYNGTGYTDIGLNGWLVQTVGINDNGDVIAQVQKTEGSKLSSFICNGTVCKELLPGWQEVQVMDINENGDVVGYGINASGKKRGFIIYSDGTFTEIYQDGWIDPMATGINDDGTIVGSFTGANGVEGFVAELQTNAVPEPASLLLLISGISALAILRRKREK